MVCPYCAAGTKVTNTRRQKRSNQVWRRRRCLVCGNDFTTHELIELGSTVMVRFTHRTVMPFSRDVLFLSIHASCRHRPDAAIDAGALTQTVISALLPRIRGGIIERDDIATAVWTTLRRFDSTAAAVYRAYHPLHTGENTA